MELKDIYFLIKDDLELVEKNISQVADSEINLLTRGAAHISRAGGKRLRPALVLLSSGACGSGGVRTIHLATAVELMHTASLIHDDIMDEAILRRGQPTVNGKWDNLFAVITGDYLYCKVFSFLAKNKEFEIISILAATTARMCEGEIAQIARRNDSDISEGEYLSIIEGKTASLFSACCRIGTLTDGTAGHLGDALARYGLNFGMGFQIVDDVLDVTGKEKELGKPVHNDIRDGRLTLPIIRALREAEGTDRTHLSSAIKNRDNNLIMQLVNRHDGIESSIETACQYVRKAQNELNHLQDSPYKEGLLRIAEYVLKSMRRAVGV